MTSQREVAKDMLAILSKGDSGVLSAFDRGEVFVSERIMADYSILRPMNPKERQWVKNFEKEFEAIVYHVSRVQFEFGPVVCMMFTGKHPEEWEGDVVSAQENGWFRSKCPDEAGSGDMGDIGGEWKNGAFVREF